jgi:hypothetical protein
MDFSQLLLDKTDAILEKWVEAVRQDNHIESDDNLSNSALENHLSHVLAAMATVLSESKTSEIQPIVKASLHHGVLRAEQGFEPMEIAREYSLLRQVIFSTLEPALLQGSPTELIRAVRLIDAVVDEATSQCFNSYVDERLEGLEQLHSQLKLTNQELTRLVRANQDNFSHLAHELRTPLTSIIGYSDLFLRKQRQNAAIKDSFANLEHIERVLRNGRQLLRLINDSLEVSRYEAGKMNLQVVPTDVRSLIKNVIEVLEPFTRAKGIKMVVECDRAPDQVLTDSLRLQQIVTNLASNAIRYTDSGSVKVSCQVLADDKWAITVSDTGIGIAPEDQTIIFDPFVQAGSTNNPHLPDSTGLGLAIVSRLVKLLQGKIELVSQVGVGSTFTVILPFSLL